MTMSSTAPAFECTRWPVPGRAALAVICCSVIVLGASDVAGHGAPIIDGIYTADWCAPALVGAFGADSLTVLAPPLCQLGTEIFWDDWDGINYGPSDTIGFLVGGLPGAPGVPGLPFPDPEVDIDFFATTADPANVYFTVSLGLFPSTVGVPPHVQIAIDVDGPAGGNPIWYDPLGAGVVPMGLAALPTGIFADYLITTDGPSGTAMVWEGITTPGVWLPVGPAPMAWGTGPVPPGPSVIEIMVPWPMFMPPPLGGPPFVPGTPVTMTVMAAHGAPFAGVADAPATPADDVFSEAVGLPVPITSSPDLCAPGPPSSDCETYVGPGGGPLTSDAFISVLYPTADLGITKTDVVTTVIPGTQVVYTITAGNPTGPSTATGATVSDTFPAALSGCTWTCTGTVGGACTATGSGNISDSVTLPMGATVTYVATCNLANNASGSLVNTATITPPIGIIEPNAGNDSATDTDTVLGLDFGDAPDPTYLTLQASGGARHAITGAFLGVSVDPEADGQPTAMADGDDLDGNDDEDGVSFTPGIVAGQLAPVSVTASAPALLDGWVDFNADGDWIDAGEQVFAGVMVAAGANALSISPPASATAGNTFARFRLSSTGGLAPWGLASDGEVEDAMVTVARSADLAMSTSDMIDPAVAGLGLSYTLSTTNNGPSDASGVTVTDTLPTTTTFLGSVPGSPTCTHSSGTVTCNLGQIAASAGSDVTITVLVDAGATGSLSNTASVAATEPDPVAGNDSDTEATTVVTPLFADAFETGDTTLWSSATP